MKKINLLLTIATVLMTAPIEKSSAHSITCRGLDPAIYGDYSWHETTVHWTFIEQMVQTCHEQGGSPMVTREIPGLSVPELIEGIDY